MNNNGSDLSAITSLYILSRLLQVVGGRSMINNVAGVILYHFLNLNARTLTEGNASDMSNEVKPFSKCLNEVEKIISYAPESKGDGNINGNYPDSLLEDFRTRVNISCSNDMRPREIRLVMSGYLPSVMSQSDLVGFGIFQNFQSLQSICLKYTISRLVEIVTCYSMCLQTRRVSYLGIYMDPVTIWSSIYDDTVLTSHFNATQVIHIITQDNSHTATSTQLQCKLAQLFFL
ncbi:hypothetical protein S83_065266 [Arachis hypogaea]